MKKTEKYNISFKEVVYGPLPLLSDRWLYITINGLTVSWALIRPRTFNEKKSVSYNLKALFGKDTVKSKKKYWLDLYKSSMFLNDNGFNVTPKDTVKEKVIEDEERH